MSALFATAVACNSIVFVFVVRAESAFICCFMAIVSTFVTITGFCILKYAERTQLLSQNLAKEFEVRVYSHIRQLGSVSYTSSKCKAQAACHFRRSFRKQCLVLHMEPFGAVKSGHAGTWIQQIIENTVTAIFMVTLGENRIFF